MLGGWQGLWWGATASRPFPTAGVGTYEPHDGEHIQAVFSTY